MSRFNYFGLRQLPIFCIAILALFFSAERCLSQELDPPGILEYFDPLGMLPSAIFQALSETEARFFGFPLISGDFEIYGTELLIIEADNPGGCSSLGCIKAFLEIDLDEILQIHIFVSGPVRRVYLGEPGWVCIETENEFCIKTLGGAN